MHRKLDFFPYSLNMLKKIIFGSLPILLLACGSTQEFGDGSIWNPEDQNNRLVYGMKDAVSGEYELYSIRANGSEPKNLSQSTAPDFPVGIYEKRVFLLSQADNDKGAYHLFETDAMGKEFTLINAISLAPTTIDVQLGGEKYVGVVGEDGVQFLVSMDLKSGILDQKWTPPFRDFKNPIWRNFNKQIFFIAKAENEKNLIFSMNVSDGSCAVISPNGMPKNIEDIEHLRKVDNSHFSYVVTIEGKKHLYVSDGVDCFEIAIKGKQVNFHTWSANGKYLYFIDENAELMVYDRVSKTTVRLIEGKGAVFPLVVN